MCRLQDRDQMQVAAGDGQQSHWHAPFIGHLIISFIATSTALSFMTLHVFNISLPFACDRALHVIKTQ